MNKTNYKAYNSLKRDEAYKTGIRYGNIAISRWLKTKNPKDSTAKYLFDKNKYYQEKMFTAMSKCNSLESEFYRGKADAYGYPLHNKGKRLKR